MLNTLCGSAKERTSDRDLQLMKEKRESLQKRIEVTSALINEREREISSLEAQLENVKTMGEMKSLKAQPAKQLIEAGVSILGILVLLLGGLTFVDIHRFMRLSFFCSYRCNSIFTGQIC